MIKKIKKFILGLFKKEIEVVEIIGLFKKEIEVVEINYNFEIDYNLNTGNDYQLSFRYAERDI